MNAKLIRPLGRLLGNLFPDLAAEVARHFATRPMGRRRRPDPEGAEPVTFRVAGLNWSSDGTTFTLRFREATCSLPWLHAVLGHWSRRTQSTLTLKEDLRLLPLKFKLPRAA